MLSTLFLAAEPSPCLDAFDTNDDGQLEIGDPLGLLFYLMQGTPSMNASCTTDRTGDGLSRCDRPSCEP
jgi:hypothetical protein